MADVVQKVITANAIVQGAVTIMPVSPVLGDKHQNIDPKITDSFTVTTIEEKYTERFN